MKKTILVICAMLISIHVMAQKYLEVYQNGKVTNSFATTSIDSVGLTGNTSQNRKVYFYRDGKIVSNYLVSGVDSIKIFRSNEEQLVYLGIIGFNQKLYEKPFDVLAKSTSNLFQSFVNDLPRKDGTLLYYAVDHALDALENYDFKTPIKNVTLITFTDGLDQGSLMMNNRFSTDEQYLNAVSQRISNIKIKGLPLTAYSLGLVGDDVSNYSLFRKNLNMLASSYEKAFEVSNMDDVQTRLKEISDQIISISTRQTISMKIPGHSDGTLIRFTLDGSSAENSSMYIEGTFNLANRTLTNVTYHGIKATTGSFVQGTQDGIFVTFTFTGMQREDGVGLIPTYNTREYYKTFGSNTWQRNSEFSPYNNTQTNITHSGAAIVLVLDCSNSLGSQFSNMRSYANDFINWVATNTSKFEVLAPTNVKAFIPDDNFEIKVTWDAVKHAESYDIYRSEYSSSNFDKVAAGVTSTSWVDEKAANDKLYYYQVVATGHGLSSPQSKTTNGVSLSLDSPGKVTATLLEDDFVIKVSWNAVKFAETYDVYRCESSSGGFDVVARGLTTTFWIDKSPLKGKNYYKVCAVGHGTESNYSHVTSYLSYYLNIPTNVHASIDDDDFVVNVSWDAVKHAESYQIVRSNRPTFDFETVATGVTSTSWIDESPLAGNNYYKIWAIGHGTASSSSSEATNVVNVKYVLDAPTNVIASLLNNSFGIKVSWDAVKRAERYDVYRSNRSSGSFTKIISGITDTSWVDDKPLPGSNCYRVCALGHGLTSEFSNTTNIVDCILEAPKNVTATIEETNGKLVVKINWDMVKYAEGYKIYVFYEGTYRLVGTISSSTSFTDQQPPLGNIHYVVVAFGHGLTSTSNKSNDVLTILDLTIDIKGISFKMIKVKGGTFQMGGTPEQGSDALENEYPIHKVTLSDYYIGETEVTQELWQAVMGNNPVMNVNNPKLINSKFPVFYFDWNVCQDFIRKLSQLTGKNFRLPTEAEWEFAARGGNLSKGYKYSGSNNLSDISWWVEDQMLAKDVSNHSNLAPHVVATKAPNELGIYDMSGNVSERCSDWYGEYVSSDQINPIGPLSGDFHVCRGGEYFWSHFTANGENDNRVSFRDISYSAVSKGGEPIGLRLALTSP